ncbi:MAG: hypothetical protein JW837_16385 [Sedimentisphaerales bacterium]|nr:hypothetical protein [Sedimentisphaerales bacterium]
MSRSICDFNGREKIVRGPGCPNYPPDYPNSVIRPNDFSLEPEPEPVLFVTPAHWPDEEEIRPQTPEPSEQVIKKQAIAENKRDDLSVAQDTAYKKAYT